MPETDEEWQEAVNWAELLLDIYEVMASNGVTAIRGQQINVRRCHEILTEGAARGFMPAIPDPDEE